MLIFKGFGFGMALLAGLLGGYSLSAADPETWDGTILQYGKMHAAIGQQQHQGRVEFSKVLERPHFFGVAALAKLAGEATILDGKLTVTRVNDKGELKADEPTSLNDSATLLIGAYVPSWTEQKIASDVEPNALEQMVVDAADRAGIRTEKPFVFTLEGNFSQLRLHVIHGACPLHARLKKIELARELQPVEVELEKVQGTLMGIFAKDAVGDITHPATSTHMHLVFKDARSGKIVTGHVEQIGVLKGSILRLPKSN
jgi:alpha-acetolactate decarboxylase